MRKQFTAVGIRGSSLLQLVFNTIGRDAKARVCLFMADPRYPFVVVRIIQSITKLELTMTRQDRQIPWPAAHAEARSLYFEQCQYHRSFELVKRIN